MGSCGSKHARFDAEEPSGAKLDVEGSRRLSLENTNLFHSPFGVEEAGGDERAVPAPESNINSKEKDGEKKALYDAVVAAATSNLINTVYLYDTLNFEDEPPRLNALEECGVLDTAPESRFDVVTQLLGKVLDVPVALVSLIDRDSLWFKSNYGPFGSCVEREGSFCSYITVHDQHEVLVVPDATKDVRFTANPYVCGPPFVRYYAGCPLVTTSGYRIGTLCMTDFKPRYFPASAYNLLCNFAEVIVREVERDAVQKALALEEERSGGKEEQEGGKYPLAVIPAAHEPVVMVHVSDPKWPLFYANEAWKRMVSPDNDDLNSLSAVSSAFWDIFTPVEGSEAAPALQKQVSEGIPASLRVHLAAEIERNTPNPTVYQVDFRLAGRDRLKNSIPVGIPGFIAAQEGTGGAETFPELHFDSLWIGTVQRVGSGKGGKILPSQTESFETWSIRDASDGTIGKGGVPLSQGSSLPRRRSLEGFARARPERWSRLVLGQLIGQGSFGRCFRGKLGDKTVAVKIVEIPNDTSSAVSSRKSSGASKGSQAQFSAKQAMLEAALSRRLAHPCIVATMDYAMVTNANGNLEVWIVQHLCDQGTLYDNLDRGLFRTALHLTAGPDLQTLLATAHDIASALCYVHEQGLIHGDLSGNNILLSSVNNAQGFRALLSDFGLSRGLDAKTVGNSAVGTITHMPPELLMEGTLTRAVDTYAFGVLIWELYCGKRAWAGMKLGTIIYQVTQLNRKLEMPEGCPTALKELAEACMATEHTQRPEFFEIVEKLESMQKELLN